jgi:hypothetical protein
VAVDEYIEKWRLNDHPEKGTSDTRNILPSLILFPDLTSDDYIKDYENDVENLALLSGRYKQPVVWPLKSCKVPKVCDFFAKFQTKAWCKGHFLAAM